MAHSYVALDVECRRSCEAESLEVRVDECLVHGVVHAQRALELGDEFGVDGAPVVINQLDLFVGTVVRVAVVDDNVESVPLAAHEDHQGQGVADVNGFGHPLPAGPVTLTNLHVTGWRGQREMHRVSRVHPSMTRKLKRGKRGHKKTQSN